MRKIPTVFRRDPADMRRLLPEVHPDCQWVLDGEGEATRKYDGTCVMLDSEGEWWARREVKPGQLPKGFQPLMTDEGTGKTVGWEPIKASPFAKFHAEAAERCADEPGTYELCGPKIQGNPEGYNRHVLVRHSAAQRLGAPRNFDDLRAYVLTNHFEGIVWHHPDGRMAKLKAKDFRA